MEKSQTVQKLCKTAANMYRLGWHERNAGNVSVMLDEPDYAPLKSAKVIRQIPLNFSTALAGKYFLVTGTGKYFKNFEADPEANLGIMRIEQDGKTASLLWGYSDGGKPTSEFSAHLLSHEARLSVNPANRVIMHGHPANIVAMSYVHDLDEAKFSKTLWQMCFEAVLIFPEGLAVLPMMLAGTNEIGKATADKMRSFKAVLWAMHGIFGSGATLDEAFGLIETAEKAAEIYLKTKGHSIVNLTTPQQLTALCEFWGVKINKGFLK